MSRNPGEPPRPPRRPRPPERPTAPIDPYDLAEAEPEAAPPPEPTTCCGRGCNGCVWEGFLEAAEYWRQEALLQLQD